MKGIIKKVELKEYKTKEDKSFKKLNFEIQTTFKFSWSEDFAKVYLKKCGLKTKDLIDKMCIITLEPQTFTNNEGKEINFIGVKYLNFTDKEGKIILADINKKEFDYDDLPF